MMIGRRCLRTIATVSIALALVVAFAAVASACPSCKDALAENDPTHQGLVRGYFYSILFMMSMPFILLGSFGSYMYFEVRRARGKQQADHDDPSRVPRG